MFSAILILLVMPFVDLSRSRGITFKPLSKAAFFLFLANFLVLLTLGAKHVESPFIEFGQISTVLYFAHFLIIVPSISLLENSLVELALASPTQERSGFKHEGAAREGMVRATVISGYSSYLSHIAHRCKSFMTITIDDCYENYCPMPNPNPGPGDKTIYTEKVDGRPGQVITLPGLNEPTGDLIEAKYPEAKPSGPTDKPDFIPDLKRIRFNYDIRLLNIPFFIACVSLIGLVM